MEFCPMSTDENNKRNATPKPIAPPPKKKAPHTCTCIYTVLMKAQVVVV